LTEQRRIVIKIEKLSTLLDAGVRALETAKTQLKRYRQAVLRYAFEGRLTEEWRKSNKDRTEPAQALLQHIKQERQEKTRAKYEPSPVDTFNFPPLPEGWTWTKSGNLSWFVTSGSRDWKKHYSNSGPLFIRTEDINTNRLSLNNVAHVSLPERVEGKRSLVEKNDILIIITGANVGKVALVNQEIGEAYVSQSVALMKLVIPETARFVHFAMIAGGFGKTELSKMVYGMGRPVLSLKNVQEIRLPFAPLLEQQEVVEEIERRLSVADEMEKTVERSLKQSDRLKHSILKRAFEGKLVTQDPNDEPAEKLLARIKEETKTNTKREKAEQVELIRYAK
jgi:type I restriction enzyme S subunit